MTRKFIAAVLALACATMVISCGSKGKTITEGSKSNMDSLSYCLGANIGSGIKEQMSDIPFCLQTVKSGILEAVTETSRQTQDEAVEILREFFMQTLGERREAVAAKKAEGSADASAELFETAEECESISYALGNDIGCNLRSSKLPIQTYWLLKGFQDAYEGSTEISQEDVMKYLQHYFMVVRPAEAAERSAKWLEQKEKSFGVKKTESGLLYKVIKAGDLDNAAKKDEDAVKVHYVGKLQNGTVFDASRFADRSKEQQEMIRQARPDMFDEKGRLTVEDEPIEFQLNRVIAGWKEGMKLVGPGGKIKLYIPAELAYGARGAGRDIGPNEALEFTVELLSVTPFVDEPDTTTPAEAEPAKAE